MGQSLSESCLYLDVDGLGFPWVVTTKGNVYFMKKIVDDSVLFIKAWDAEEHSHQKAVDIGCGQDNSTMCYIAVENSTSPYYFNGMTFMKSSEYEANSAILRLDVGSGVGGTVITVVNSENFVLELRRNTPPISLGMSALDVTVGFNNQIYICNGFGLYYKSKCSKFFVLIHDIFAKSISSGLTLWVVGSDNFIYNGTVNSYVNDC